MPDKIYRVRLMDEEREQSAQLISKGRTAVQKQTHARILLLSDEDSEHGGKKHREIVAALNISQRTVERVRERFVEEGLDAALNRKPSRRVREKKLDGKGEAYLVALACSAPPEGRVNWTMHLLANRLVECKIVDSISDETVRQTLKKTN